jgi:hypothetical protein
MPTQHTTHPHRLVITALFFAAGLLLLTARPAVATTASIAPDGNILVNGQPFFPIGIYHVSWIGNRQGGKAVPDLQLAADAGFNLIVPTIDARNDTQDLLDAAASRGMYVIGETPWPENGPGGFVNKWKNEQAMIGWLLADDFNVPYHGPAYNHSPAQVAARRAELASLAPQHLGYASGGSYPGFRIAEFVGTMDVMGFQSYPLGAQNNPDEYALQENVDSFDWVRDQLAGTGQTFVANPQAYKWGGSRYPTPREARNLLYAPLLRGAKGVIWYAMWEGSDRYLPKTAPDLWAAMPALNRETATLAPFLLHGTRTELATGDARLHAARWELDNQTLVLVIGTHRDGVRSTSLALPAAATGAALPLFPMRSESGLTVSGGQLVGNVGPEEVHAYLIDHAVSGDVSPVASFGVAPAPPAFGSAATLDGSASSDGDGSVVAWEWDFGDGAQATGAVVNHTWSAPGTYAVRLTVRDDDGAPATTIVPVEVGVTALCPAAPLPGCRSGSSTLSLRDTGSAARRTLSWTWKKGAASLAELGDPTASTEVALCVWDASGRALATSSRAGAAWDALGSAGFRLRDPAGGAGGVIQARLKPGGGTAASLVVKAKGAKLPAADLPLSAPVTVQLVTSDGGACWQGVYAAGGSTRSTATSFRGKD